MDFSGVDWGSVPEYLVVIGLVGGLIAGIRAWTKERRQERELARQEREERVTGAAMVIAYLIPPLRSARHERSLICGVESLAGTPVFLVTLHVRYVGTSNKIPDGLRDLIYEHPTLTGREQHIESYEKWPDIEYQVTVFDWALRFTDVQGTRWLRTPREMPQPINTPDTE